MTKQTKKLRRGAAPICAPEGVASGKPSQNSLARRAPRESRAALGMAGVACLAAALWSRDARADFASDAVSIVEQLVEDDIVTQVVPNTAASFPATCDMVPASIYALRAKRYGGFPTIVRQEVADTLGFLVLVKAEGNNLDTLTPKLPRPLRQQTIDVMSELLGGKLPAPKSLDSLNTLPCSFDAAVGLKKGSKTITFRTQQTLAAGSTITFSSDSPAVPYTLADAFNGDLKGDMTTEYAGAADVSATADSVPPGRQWAPQSGIPTVVMQSCGATQPTPGAEVACAAALAVRDLTMGNFTAAQTDLRRVLLAVAADKLVAAVGKDFAGTLALLRQQSSSPGTPLRPEDVAGGLVQDKDRAQLVAAAAQIQAEAQKVLGLSASQVTTVEQLVAAVVDWLGKDAVSPGVATAVAAVTSLAAGVVQIVSDLQAKEYGNAANDAFVAMDAVAKRVCATAAAGKSPLYCTKTAGLVREFLRAATVYAVDSAVNGSVNATVSSGFRDAAVALIEDQGGAGVRRSTFKAPAAVYIPDFALRAGLRPGFATGTPTGTLSSAFVTYASVDYPNLRAQFTRSTARIWVGGNFSFLDGIGPLVELAQRNATLGINGTSEVRSDAFWLGFIVPRLELEFAIPELSRNLALGLGTAARFYRADQVVSGVGPVQASYCIVGNPGSCLGRQDFNGNNLEGSIFVKFVP